MPKDNPFQGKNIHFVTGRLAEFALRRTIDQLVGEFGFTATVQVLPITVAALMTPVWIAKYLEIPPDCDLVLLPGYCDSDLKPILERTSTEVQVGPKDLRRLGEFFGASHRSYEGLEYSIEIIAEINHAPRLPVEQLILTAESLRNDGADVIDIGCEPAAVWQDVDVAVRELVDRGFRISIDSLDPKEIEPAVAAGAELVLSVNSGNREAARDWGCEVVVIPDDPADWLQITRTVDFLAAQNVPLRIDPILEPVGLGLANSLMRYFESRRIWPDAQMMMGIGNLTELTDVDSAGINILLLSICQELGISSVLTTQVVNWARSSVRECDIARRMAEVAVGSGTPPKNLDDRLVCLRDPRILENGIERLEQLATEIRDNNYRIFAEGQLLHLLGSGHHWSDVDAFELFDQLMQSEPANVDAGHAFYLGYELCKASLALQLGKNYEQDESLQWGHLTVPETNRRRLKRSRKKK